MNRALVASIMMFAIAACGDNSKEFGIRLFAASPDAIEMGGTAKLLFVVDPPTAHAEINGMNVTGMTELTVTPSATTTYQLDASEGSHHESQSVTITVGPHVAAGLKVESMNPTPTAGDVFMVTVTALTGDGSVSPGYRGTVHLTSSDAQGVLPTDLTFDATDMGVKTAMVTLKTAGVETVTGTDVAHAGTSGTTTVSVGPGAAASYQLTTLPAMASAGEGLGLTITARDMFGNVATTYAGSAQLTSTDATDILPAAGTFTNGVRIVTLAFTRAGSHFATVSDVATTLPSVDTSTVVIGASLPVRIDITGANPNTTAGSIEGFTASLVDLYDNPATNFVGTVHFTASDAQADVPVDYTYTALDAGAHAFAVTFKTAGSENLHVADLGSAATGDNAWLVGAGPASACLATQAPATAVAGSVVGLTVTIKDQFNNTAANYAGTISLSSSDARAILPAPVTYGLADAGAHAFSASLITAGAQSLTATDSASPFQCALTIAVSPAAPKIIVTLPTDANAGYGVNVGVAVRDIFDNAITNFAGTVSFTSTDSGSGAVTPAPIVFTGSEGGVGSSSATFVTIGSQTIAASDGATANGNAACSVHGLVYTGPTNGRVRLVANAAASNTQIVQLDLVANERLETATNFFGGGPGSFAAGMNLPLDTTRVLGDTTLFIAGNALPATLVPPPVSAAKIGATDHVLYTAISRKRTTGTIFTQETEVLAGQVFYSVRLKLTQTGTVGPVFDGASPSVLFRAAVRDQYGDDFVNLGDFGIGKLEIR